MNAQPGDRPSGGSDPLLGAARAGDRAARGRALRRCYDALYRVAASALAADPDLRAAGGPDDLVQETLLEAERDFRQFRGQTGTVLHAWLVGILRHKLAGWRRRRPPRAVSLDSGPAAARLREELIDPRPGPEQLAIGKEEGEAMSRVLATLSPGKQEVVRLRFEEDCSFAEVGRRLGCSAAASRQSCHRSLRALRHKLADPSEAPGDGADPDGPAAGGEEGGGR
jgi:RNA polymerase sigma-70 factor (ECF subfamily)